jgi:hypothetical protein
MGDLCGRQNHHRNVAGPIVSARDSVMDWFGYRDQVLVLHAWGGELQDPVEAQGYTSLALAAAGLAADGTK